MLNDALKLRQLRRMSRGAPAAIASVLDASEAARRFRGNRSRHRGVWVFALAIMGCGQPSIGGGPSPSSAGNGRAGANSATSAGGANADGGPVASAGGANTDGGLTESQACVYHQQSTFDCGTGALPVTSTLCSDGSCSFVGSGEGLAVGGCTSVDINSDLTPIAGSCATWDHKFPGDDDAGNGGVVQYDAGPAPMSRPDGTSGKACALDADCRVAAGGTNICSTSFSLTGGAASAAPYPTPVCIVPPGAADGCADPSVLYCDGSNDPGSPGVCVPDSPHADCLPKCTFTYDGNAAQGCRGHDACFALYDGVTDGSVLEGIGYCFSACEADADCSADPGTRCDRESGACETSPLPPTKALGDACTAADKASGACNCYQGPSGSGYCVQACVTGGAPCPNGWICDPRVESAIDLGQGQVLRPSAVSPGIVGLCLAPCTVAGTDPACPASSACRTETFAGPDCVPN
jgi:hypothetical protein